MIVIIILLLVAVAAVGAWQYQLSQANALAAQVAIERIQAESRLDLAPWIFAGLVVICLAVVLVFYFRRPGPVVNDNRTVILLGQSKREFYKRLNDEISNAPRMETRNQLVNAPLLPLGDTSQYPQLPGRFGYAEPDRKGT